MTLLVDVLWGSGNISSAGIYEIVFEKHSLTKRMRWAPLSTDSRIFLISSSIEVFLACVTCGELCGLSSMSRCPDLRITRLQLRLCKCPHLGHQLVVRRRCYGWRCWRTCFSGPGNHFNVQIRRRWLSQSLYALSVCFVGSGQKVAAGSLLGLQADVWFPYRWISSSLKRSTSTWSSRD